MTGEWCGCYAKGWQGLLVPEAFAHPAKVSLALAERMYDHAIEQGWLRAGDTVVDPFGGVGGFALSAMRRGLVWRGVELEAKFVALAQQNIDLWNLRYKAHFSTWGSARVHCGDSRRLREVIGAADMCCSSPPFQQSEPCQDDKFRLNDGRKAPPQGQGGYSDSPANLGNMRATARGLADACMSSPPYASAIQHNEKGSGIDYSKAMNGGKGRTLGRESIAVGYSDSPANLGNMPARGFDAAVRADGVISSPPFLGDGFGKSNTNSGNVVGQNRQVVSRNRAANIASGEKAHQIRYAEHTDGQLGGEAPDDFWSASKQIVSEVYAVLKPGGVSMWVLKAFVRKGVIVDFPEQWEALCIAVGFETCCVHRAMLVEHKGTQHTMNGDAPKELRTERKSFFRRLAERRGSPKIDFEVVLCMRKPSQGE